MLYGGASLRNMGVVQVFLLQLEYLHMIVSSFVKCIFWSVSGHSQFGFIFPQIQFGKHRLRGESVSGAASLCAIILWWPLISTTQFKRVCPAAAFEWMNSCHMNTDHLLENQQVIRFAASHYSLIRYRLHRGEIFVVELWPRIYNSTFYNLYLNIHFSLRSLPPWDQRMTLWHYGGRRPSS